MTWDANPGAPQYIRGMLKESMPSKHFSVKFSCAVLVEIRDSLLRHFKPQSVEIAERFTFFKRTQQSNESVTEYMATLRKMAKECNFGGYLDTALRDQLVCGMKDVSVM